MNIKKLLIIWVLLPACSDLDRDNPIDPKNPDALASQIVVVENFIHRFTDYDSIYPNIRYSQEALYQLTSRYDERMILIEYHMPLTDTSKHDTFASTANHYRYQYEYRGSAPYYFPHTFFNGKLLYTQGASGIDAARQKYSAILDTLTLKTTQLYCEAGQRFTDTSLVVTSKIARFGTTPLKNIYIEYVLVEDIGSFLFYTARDIGASEPVNIIQPEQVMDLPEKEFALKPYYNTNKLKVVMIVKKSVSKAILQSCATTQ